MIARYLTHPQVVIDPKVPVVDWGLNDIGHARVATLIASGLLSGTTRIITSAEQKARDTADPIAADLGVSTEVLERTHENDRTATGFLPGPEFEATADAFFANPDKSVRGWETARDAQTRIVTQIETALEHPTEGDILIVGHGGVGTLLYCHYAQKQIDRKYDQIGGGGCIFSFDLTTRNALTHWQTLEDFAQR